MSTPALFGKLTGATLGATLFNYLRALLFVLAGLIVAYVLVTRGWATYRAGVWKDRAKDARDVAVQAEARAVSADKGAENATLTRENMEFWRNSVNFSTNATAARIERNENATFDPASGDPSDAVLRDLEEARDAADAASARLQRTRRP